jgi:hypothetical protein
MKRRELFAREAVVERFVGHLDAILIIEGRRSAGGRAWRALAVPRHRATPKRPGTLSAPDVENEPCTSENLKGTEVLLPGW